METRFGKLGRLEAEWFCKMISSLLGFNESRKYMTKFLEELGNYSEVPKKKGAPINEGCVRELYEIKEADNSPGTYARIVKERWHTKYQKQNTSRERVAYEIEIKKFFNLQS